MMTNKCGLTMSPTAISVAVRDEIQRFESVHPNIYAIHELIDDINIPAIQQQLRDHIISIEDAFVNSQEWTLSRCVCDLKLGIVGTFNSGKSPLVHHYLTGSYLNEETFEGGRFKKEIFVDGRSYLLLIREEGGPPDMQFSQWVDAVVFVYNVTNETSFNTIYTYYAKMGLYRHMMDVPIFLIASRDGVSNSNPRIISEAKGLKMANDLKNCHYFEVCSEKGFNVELVFHEACQKILTSRQAPTSSSSLSLSSTNHQAPMNSLHRGSNKAFHTQLSSPVNISSSALSASSYSSCRNINIDNDNNVINNNIKVNSNNINHNKNSNINNNSINNNIIINNNAEESWSTCNNISKHHVQSTVHSSSSNNNNVNSNCLSSKSHTSSISSSKPPNINNINKNTNAINNNVNNNNSTLNSYNSNSLNNNANVANYNNSYDVSTDNSTNNNNNIPANYVYARKSNLDKRAVIGPTLENGCLDMTTSLHGKLTKPSDLHHHQPVCASLSSKASLNYPERIDSFLKEFPMTKERSGKTTSSNIFSSRHRSYSIQSIEQGDDDVSKDFVATPNTTPTPSRKNNRRRSNIFTSKKDCDDKKLRNGDAKLGSGRVIPIKQGWLYKKSSKPLSKDWQKKYVTLLDDGRMTYHSSLHDYMENSHGKEIKLGETTVKIPGQGPRGSGLTRTNNNNNNITGCHISRHSETNNFMSPACRDSSISNMSDSIVISNSGVLNSVSTGTSVSSSTTTIPPKLETPINKKKHRRIKSNSRNFDGSESSEYGYEFAIVSLDNKQWLFEACSLEEREEWIIAVEQQILSSLQQNRSSKAQITSNANIAVIHAVRNVSGNNECADCAAPNPEWASLNLGALICIECSGIHRNLGTHLSRVRSLELDEWPPNLVEVMTSIGNDLLNSVYEANAIGCKKPNPTSSREEKDKWIRMKYELKNYLPPLPFEGVPIQQQLMDAVACNNVHNLILVLAYCSPNDVNTPYNSTTDTRTALHIAAAFGKIILVQLLLWYGANPDLVDHENHTPSFYAKEHKAFECLKILEMVTSQ